MTRENSITVAITAIGSNTGLSVLKGLRKSSRTQYTILGTDLNAPHEIAGANMCDLFATVPRATADNFIEEIIRVCTEHNVDILIPIVDIEVEVLAQHADELKQAGIALACSPATVVTNCNDKYLTYTSLKEAGIETTTTELYTPGETAVDFPAFIKPRRGLSSAGTHRIADQEELDFFAKRVDDPIIQPLLNGVMYVVDVVNDNDGKNLVAVPRIELESKAGMGVKARTEENAAVAEYAISLAEAIGLVGPANIEVMKDGDTIELIEINPRFSSGSIISTVAGANVHEIAVLVALGTDMSEYEMSWDSDVQMHRYWKEVYYQKENLYE